MPPCFPCGVLTACTTTGWLSLIGSEWLALRNQSKAPFFVIDCASVVQLATNEDWTSCTAQRGYVAVARGLLSRAERFTVRKRTDGVCSERGTL